MDEARTDRVNYARWLWQQTPGIRLNIFLRIALSMVLTGLSLLLVAACRHFIDVTVMSPAKSIAISVAGLLALVLTITVLREITAYMRADATTRLTNNLRQNIYESVLAHPPFEEEDRLHSGDAASRFVKDVETVGGVAAAQLPQTLIYAIQTLGAFLLMRWFDKWLAWALLLGTPIVLVAGKFIAFRLREMTRNIRLAEAGIQIHLQEGVQQSALIQSLQSESWMTRRLSTMLDGLRRLVLKRARFTMLSHGIISGVFALGYMLAFVYGGLLLRQGAITFGVMTSFLQLVSMIQGPLLSMMNTMPAIIHATASIDRIAPYCTSPTPIQENANPQNSPLPSEGAATQSITPLPSEGRGRGGVAPSNRHLGVKVSGVTFRYNRQRDILRFPDLTFAPGTKTALMAPTGKGKTTLFRLMMALTEPESGTISLYDDEGSTPVSPATRSQFVYVPQASRCLSGTIRYNLLMAKPEATDEELRAVLHTACADFVLDLPGGIDTELGELSTGLSEGQAQRIAIARSLLRQGAVMLLDEVSASLDEATERELYSRLFDAYPERTFIIITHRRPPEGVGVATLN